MRKEKEEEETELKEIIIAPQNNNIENEKEIKIENRIIPHRSKYECKHPDTPPPPPPIRINQTLPTIPKINNPSLSHPKINKKNIKRSFFE